MAKVTLAILPRGNGPTVYYAMSLKAIPRAGDIVRLEGHLPATVKIKNTVIAEDVIIVMGHVIDVDEDIVKNLNEVRSEMRK